MLRDMDVLLSVLAVSSYGLAFLLHRSGVVFLNPRLVMGRSFSTVFGLLALLLHGFLLYRWTDHATGQNLSFYNQCALLIWGGLLFAQLLRVWMPLAGVVWCFYPLAAIALLADGLYSGCFLSVRQMHHVAVLHVLLSFVTMSVLCLVGVQAALTSRMDAAIKHHKLILGDHMPPLETMERQLHVLVCVAFACLTVLVFSSLGQYYARLAEFALQIKLSVAVGAWLLFAGLLLGRRMAGLRGVALYRMTLVGVILVLVVYLGSHTLSVVSQH